MVTTRLQLIYAQCHTALNKYKCFLIHMCKLYLCRNKNLYPWVVFSQLTKHNVQTCQ